MIGYMSSSAHVHTYSTNISFFLHAANFDRRGPQHSMYMRTGVGSASGAGVDAASSSSSSEDSDASSEDSDSDSSWKTEAKTGNHEGARNVRI